MINNISSFSGLANASKIDSSGNKTSDQLSFGVSFIETMAETARQARIAVPNKKNAAELNFEKYKFLNLEEHTGWGDEEDLINSFVGRIERIIKQREK